MIPAKCKIIKHLYWIPLYLLFSYNVTAQTLPDKRNTIFLEVSSKGPVYSLNYDRIVKAKNKLTYGYRTGFTIERDGIGASFGLNMLSGQKSHHAELSLVLMPYINHYKSFLSKDDLSDKYLYIIPSIGYRYQQFRGGFFFRAAAAPMLFLDPPSDHFWHMDPKLYASVQAALGFSF